VCLRSEGVRAHIVDFSSLTPPHATKLFTWVWKYFEQRHRSQLYTAGNAEVGAGVGGGRVFCSKLPPIYLQHQGHSRTIVGAVRRNGLVQLLILDPGAGAHSLKMSLGANNNWQKKFLFPVESFKVRQYQLVYVEDDGLDVADAHVSRGGGGGGGRGSSLISAGGGGGGRGGGRDGGGGESSRKTGWECRGGEESRGFFLEGWEMHAAKTIAAKERIGEGF
jgi:uncharacterized membrane protein YgcG